MKSNVTDIEYLSKTRQEYENTLSFAGRGLKLNTAEEARELVAAIGKTRPLKCLRLEGNTISPAAAEELAKALADHPELERFIGNDIFTGRLKDEIPLALKSICGSINVSGAHLVEVNMSDNAYGPIGLNALVSFFASASCYSLREIRMHNNGLGPEGSKKFAAALEKCYENSGKKFALRVFVCGRNRLEMEGSRAISAVLKTIGTLEEIQMPQNGIRSNGIQFLAEAVEANPNLRVINFNDNTFLKIGAEQIAKAIAQLKKLEYVNLGDCLLRSKGAVMVARSLANLPDLKEAILSFNEINSASGLEIARLLVDGVRQTLKLLDLNGNNFGVEGKQEIEQCLEPIKNSVASLSEDEGSEEEDERGDEDDVDNSEDEDEDEDEDEEDEDEDDEEDGEEYEGGDGYEDGEEHEQYDIIEKNEVAQTVNPFSKLVIGEAMNTSIEKVDKFIGEPNIQNLKNIDDASLDNLSKHSKFNTGFVLRIVAITSDFYDSTNAADSGVIINFSLSLFKRLFQSEENLNLFCEQFLTEFGLLKSEDKKFRPIEVSQKLIDCLQAIAKNESFPKSINKKIVDYLSIRNSNLDTKKSNSATLKKQNDYFIKCFS